MTNEQSVILNNNLFFVYYPYTFKDAIKNHCSYKYTEKEMATLAAMGKYWKFIENTKSLEILDDLIQVSQDKGVEKATLTIIVDGIESVDVSYTKGTKKVLLEKSIFKGVMVGNIDVDFENPIKQIKLNFRYDLADPLLINVETFIFEEPPVDYQKIYIDKMNVKHNVGNDLVNIYFQKANDKIDEIKVELFLSDKNGDLLIGNYSIEKNMFFKSITGLAYGSYKYRVIQFSNEVEVVATEKIGFHLSVPNYSGKNIVSSR